MSKTNDLLDFFRKNVGKWACSVCGSGSSQPAATFRTIRNMGYEFEEVEPNSNRWGKMMECDQCKKKQTHYKLLSTEPNPSKVKTRSIFTPMESKRILNILGKRDAFTGATITSVPEIDHKIPWTRLNNDYNVKEMSDEQISEAFQILTREHNLLKDRRCGKCKKNNIRPPFFGIEYWYAGGKEYKGTCEGCGWFDGVKWRECVNNKLRQ